MMPGTQICGLVFYVFISFVGGLWRGKPHKTRQPCRYSSGAGFEPGNRSEPKYSLNSGHKYVPLRYFAVGFHEFF